MALAQECKKSSYGFAKRKFMAWPIKDSRMIEIDFCYPYQLACEVRVLHQPSITFIQAFSIKETLERFVTGTKNDFLSRSKEKAKEIIALLEPLFPPGAVGNRTVTMEEWELLLEKVTQFEQELGKESKHLYIVCVENQRLLTPYVLVEQIENALAENTWKHLSGLARRELEESGRCLAFERYTASGFHALRSVEAVIREYIIATTSAPPAKRDWFHYIETLKKTGADDGVTSTLDNIRISDRNPLMHPEDFLDIDGAIDLFDICKTALNRLIADMKKRGFATVFVP